MRLAYMTMLFSSLLLWKDLDEDQPLPLRLAGEGSGRTPPPCLEGNRLLQFHENAFCWQPAFLWLAQTPWGFQLAGVAVLLLWLVVEVWATSCLAALQKKPRQTTVCLETVTEQEVDLQVPKRARPLCACQTQTAGFDSYEPPCEMHGPSSMTHCNLGSWHRREMVLYSTYRRRRPPASSSEACLKNPSSSSSSSFTSSSSSSSWSSSLCLSHLKHLDLRPPLENPPATKDSLETILGSLLPANELALSVFPERTDSVVACLDMSDSSRITEKAESRSLNVLLFTERHFGTEMLPPFPEQSGSQPLTSFAQINILQSYEKEDHILLVQKSLAICMGKVPAHKASCSLPPKPPPAAQEEEEPTELSFMDQKSLQLISRNIELKHRSAASLQGLLVTVKRTILRAASQARQRSALDTVSASTSSQADLVSLSCTQENVGEEARHFLEFHVKKKMIQRRCGIPTVVTKSLKVFHALASQFPGELVASSSQMPKQKPALVLMDAGRPLLLVSPPRQRPLARNLRTAAAKQLQKIPAKKEYSILHSVKPEEIRRLAFHASVKMLEIKMGAFPDMVEKSFQIFGLLSENPLPKMIRFGNKIRRLKHPSLPFLAREALCIIELNIKHKCLVCIWKLSTLHVKSATKVTCASLEPRELEGDATEGAAAEKPCITTSTPETCPQEAAPPPAPREPPAVPESQDPPRSLSSSLVTAMSCSSHSSAMVMTTTSRSSETRGPEEEGTDNTPQEACISQEGHFQEVTFLEPCPMEKVPWPGFRALPSSPGSQESSCSLSSALLTGMPSSSSMPRGPEDNTTKGVSKKPCTSQEMHFQEAALLESCHKEIVPCPSLRALPPVPELRDSSHPLPSPLVTALTSRSVSSTLVTTLATRSSEARRPEEEATKDVSTEPCISQEGRFQEVTILEPCPKEKAPYPSLREPTIVPKLQDSSSRALYSPLVTAMTSSSLSSALLTGMPSSSSMPRGPEDNTTKGVSKKPCISQEMHFQEAALLESCHKETVPCPSLRALPPVPELRDSSHPLPSPLVTALTSRSVSSTLVTTLATRSSEPRGPEDDTTKGVSENRRISRAVHFKEVTIPEPPPGITGLSPVPESQDSPRSLPSPLVSAMSCSSSSSQLVTTMISNSSEPRGPEDNTTKGVSKKTCIPRVPHFQEVTIPELCLGLRGLPPVPETQDTPRSLSSTLVTTTPSSSKPRGPDDDTTKGVSKILSVPRVPHFQEVTIPEPCPGLRGLPPVPETQDSSRSLPSTSVTTTTPRSSEPRGPEDETTKGVSKKTCIPRVPHFQEVTIPEPCPGLKGLPPVPETQDTPRSLPSTLVTTMTPSSSTPRGPEDDTTKGVSMNLSVTRAVHFEEETIPEPCPGLKGLPPVPETQDSSRSLPSALVTTMTASSSEPRGPEEDATREISRRACISQEAHLHEGTFPEPRPKETVPCPGLREWPTAPEAQESSRLLCSQLVTTMTSSSSELRGPENDTTKDVSKKLCVSQEVHFQEISILETFRKEEAPNSGLRELSRHPDSQEPSSSLSSALVSAEKLSEAYLKYVVSKKSSAHGVPSEMEKPLENPLLQKPLGKEGGQGARGERIQTERAAEVGGKGTRMEREAKDGGKRTETEKGAEADGKGTKTEKGVEGEGKGREETEAEDCWEEEGPITRTSIFLELELKKEKLNLHLKKKIAACLQPQQRAAMELSVDIDKAAPRSRKAKKAARQPSSSGREAQGKRCRPFCYVCMPLDETGSAVKTVCWALPKWILEMNGYRAPQVARFEKKPKGPGPAAK